jgi:homogentisate 1,2-dioxygenase
VKLEPKKLEGTMAFMFETRFPQKVTAWAAGADCKQESYARYGHLLKTHFDPTKP